MKKETKKSSQNDRCPLFAFTRFATERELKPVQANLNKYKFTVHWLRVLAGQRTALDKIL
jgi:hypothetical protein